MSSKESGCAGLLLIAGVIYLLHDCSGDKNDTPPPRGPEALYLKACEGDKNALTQLIAAKGKEAGKYQEKFGDHIQWSNPEQAEVCWQLAQRNGVEDSGPEWPYLYYIVKHWKLSVGAIVGLIIMLIALSRSRVRKPEKKARKTPYPFEPHSVLILDTNIWMSDTLNNWFSSLPELARRYKWKLHLESIVLGELKGLSKNETKGTSARNAMKRIESLQESMGSDVQVEDNARHGKDTIADTVLLHKAKRTSHAILITDDRELRILARSQGIQTATSRDLKS